MGIDPEHWLTRYAYDRRKKCDDNTYPICGHCRRLNLECVREAPRALNIPGLNTTSDLFHQQPLPSPGINYGSGPSLGSLGARRRASSGEVSMVIPEGLGMPLGGNEGAMGGNGDRRYLLKYYTQVLSALVTTNHENNSFLSGALPSSHSSPFTPYHIRLEDNLLTSPVFLPMAIESPPLLSSLIAWSCAHLSCFHPLYHTSLLEKRGHALRLVASSLSIPSPSIVAQETNLAASLVLCSTEVVFGDTSMWHKHLIGAQQIITSASRGDVTGPRALMETLDGEWLLRNFAYHDVLGSVSTGQPPLIRGAYWLRDTVEVVDTYMGVGSRILAFISQISCLKLPRVKDAAPETDPGSPDTDTEADVAFEEAWRALELGLLEWTCPVAIQPGLVPLAEAYRSAALLYLYRKKRSYLHLSPSPSSASALPAINALIAAQVSAILGYLAQIPLTSLPETGMLFPIFMAGGDTERAAEMEMIRMRLRNMTEFRGFGNIRRASEVLEELWRARATGVKGRGGREVDWMDVLERTGWMLMLG